MELARFTQLKPPPVDYCAFLILHLDDYVEECLKVAAIGVDAHEDLGPSRKRTVCPGE